MSSHWKDLGVYTCEKCSLKTQDEAVFRHHPCKSKCSVEPVIRYNSKTGMFTCSLCNIQLNNQAIIEHLQFHLWEKLFQCSLCGLELSSHTEVNAHCKEHHAQEKVKIIILSPYANLLKEAMQNGHASFKPKNVNPNDRTKYIEKVPPHPPLYVHYRPGMSSALSQNQDKETVQSQVAIPVTSSPFTSEVLTNSHSFHNWQIANAAQVYSLQVAHPLTNYVQRSSFHRPSHRMQSPRLYVPETSMYMNCHSEGSNVAPVGSNCSQKTFNVFNGNQVGISNPQPKSLSLRDGSTGMQLLTSVNNNASLQPLTGTLYSSPFSKDMQKKMVNSIAATEHSPGRASSARIPDSLCSSQTKANIRTANKEAQSTGSVAQEPCTKRGGVKSKLNSSFLILVRNIFLCLICKMKWKVASKTLFLEHVWKEHAHCDGDFSCCSEDKFSANCSRLQTLMVSQFKSNYVDTNTEEWQKSTNNMENTNALSSISERNPSSVNGQSVDSLTSISDTSSSATTHAAEVHDYDTVSEKQILEENMSSASDELVIDLTVLNTSGSCLSEATSTPQIEDHEKEMSQELGSTSTSSLQTNLRAQKEVDGQIESCEPGIQVSKSISPRSICTETETVTVRKPTGELVQTAGIAEGSQNSNSEVEHVHSKLKTPSEVKKQSPAISNDVAEGSEERLQPLSDSQAETIHTQNVTACISHDEVASESTQNALKNHTLFKLLTYATVDTLKRRESSHVNVAQNVQKTPQNSEVSPCTSGCISVRPPAQKNGSVCENVDKMYYKCGCRDCTFSSHKPQDLRVHLRDLHKTETSFSCIYCGFQEACLDKLIEHMDSHVLDASDRPVISVSCLLGEEKIEAVSGHNFEMTVRKLDYLSAHNKSDIIYLCNKCDTSFITLEDLREHLSKSLLKIVGCGYCESKFLDSVMCNRHIVQEHAQKTVYRRVDEKLLCKERKANTWRKESSDSSSSDQHERKCLTEDSTGVAQGIQNGNPETDYETENLGNMSEQILNLSDSEKQVDFSSTMLSKNILKPLGQHRNENSIELVTQKCMLESSPSDIDRTEKLGFGSAELSTLDICTSVHTSPETHVDDNTDPESSPDIDQTENLSSGSTKLLILAETHAVEDNIDPQSSPDDIDQTEKLSCGFTELPTLAETHAVEDNIDPESSPDDIDQTEKVSCGSTELPTLDICISEHTSPESHAMEDNIDPESSPEDIDQTEKVSCGSTELPILDICISGHTIPAESHAMEDNIDPESSPGDIDQTEKVSCGSTELPILDICISGHTFPAESHAMDDKINHKSSPEDSDQTEKVSCGSTELPTPAMGDNVGEKSWRSNDSEKEIIQEKVGIGNGVSGSALLETGTASCLDHSFMPLDPTMSADETENELNSNLPKLFDLCGSKKMDECLTSFYFLDKNRYCCGECKKMFPCLKHLHCHIFLCQGKLGVVICYLCHSQFEHPDHFKNHFQKEHTSSPRKVLYSEVKEEILEKLKASALSPEMFANLCKELRTSEQNLCVEIVDSSCNLECDVPELTVDTEWHVEQAIVSGSPVLIRDTNSSDVVVVDTAGLSPEFERQDGLSYMPKEMNKSSLAEVNELELPVENEVQDKLQSAVSNEIPSKKLELTENCDQKMCTYEKPKDQRMETSNGIGSLNSEAEKSPSLQNSLTETRTTKNKHSKTRKHDFLRGKERELFKCSVCEFQSYSYIEVRKHVKMAGCQYARVKMVHSENGKSLMSHGPKDKAAKLKTKEQRQEECNYKCHICDLIVPWDPTKMQKHIENQHSFYCSCGYCGSIYYRQSKLINHLRFVHRGKETKIQPMNYNAVFSPVKLQQTEIDEIMPTDELNANTSEGAKKRKILVKTKSSDKRMQPEKNAPKNGGTVKSESTRKEVTQSSFSSSRKTKVARAGSKQKKNNVLNTVVQGRELFQNAPVASKPSTGEEVAKTFLCDSELREGGLCETEPASNVEKENSPVIETVSVQSAKDISSVSLVTNNQKDTTAPAETPALKRKDNLDSIRVSGNKRLCPSQKLIKSAPAVKPCTPPEVSRVLPGKSDFPFECTQCQACMTSIFHLKGHFKKRHAGEVVSFIERRSESIFNSAGMQLGGKSGSTPSERHLCGYCPYRSEFRTSVLKHSLTAHNKKSCLSLRRHPDQRKLTQTKGPSESHMSVTCYRCHICGETVNTEFMFRLHLAKHGGFTKTTKLLPSHGILICPCCGYIATSSMDHTRHLDNHQSDRRFACSLCGQDDHFKKNLWKHIKTAHDDEPSAQVLDRNKLTKQVNMRPSLVNLDAKVRLVDPFVQNKDYLWNLLLDNNIKMIDVVVEDCENILDYRNHDFFDIKFL